MDYVKEMEKTDQLLVTHGGGEIVTFDWIYSILLYQSWCTFLF